jgi:phosphohistidine swiveling domain-containing protein
MGCVMTADLTTLDHSGSLPRRELVGGKAAVLAELSAAGFAVPPGFVVTESVSAEAITVAARRLGGERFAVRSSAVAEDLPGASYAGLYDTFLDVPVGGLADAVRRCFAAASTERVTAYHRRQGGGTGMAVLVQAMVDAVAAGVAFTADPLTGDRKRTIVTAVAGLGESLVAGTNSGEQWTAEGGTVRLTRAGPAPVLTAGQAAAVVGLARQVADHYGRPQDVEWAIDRHGELWLLQARPMTALPEPVSWPPPGPGLWWRHFRLGEWLPEAVTPLFATWLLLLIEDGYLDAMHVSVGVRVPFRYALVNGWYYNATPIPSPALLVRVLARGRVRILYQVLIRVGRDPAGADRAVLAALERTWREEQLPRYRRLVAAAGSEAGTADLSRLITLVEQLGREAGAALWYLAVVGGSAWKMEACLARFARRHLKAVLPEQGGGAQVLLRGLPGTEPVASLHAVQSLDWYHPVIATEPTGSGRHAELCAQRLAAEQQCIDALADRPHLAHRFASLLDVTQRYAAIREEQARDLTLAWPVLRTCARRLGEHLTDPDDVFFCTRAEIGTEPALLADRRALWQRQRRLAAPLTLGRPPRLIGDVLEHAAGQARSTDFAAGAIVGHPASAGRATGPARILTDPQDYAGFAAGDVLVTKATTPAWTPLFALAAAVVTDGGSLAAHASLVAREYGIPAVVGTGDATHRITPGCLVTVDGTAGTVTIGTHSNRGCEYRSPE